MGNKMLPVYLCPILHVILPGIKKMLHKIAGPSRGRHDWIKDKLAIYIVDIATICVDIYMSHSVLWKHDERS